jgi:co-chaperonin GroES (HSP10)
MGSAVGGAKAAVVTGSAAAEIVSTIRGAQADYIPAPWSGENTSGLRPYGRNILVRMDECSQTVGSVMITDDRKERMDAMSVTGCIYAVGPEAFHYFDNGRPWQGDKPLAGERVYVAQYSGVVAMGMDGGFYRFMDYNCLAGGYLDAEAAASAAIVHRVE